MSGSNSNSLTVVNPYDHSTVATLPFDSDDKLDKKIEAACQASIRWKRLPLQERARIVRDGLSKFQERQKQTAADITRQMGKPLQQAQAEVKTMFGRAEQSLADAPDALRPDVLPNTPGIIRRIERVPLGLVFQIAAWNYPLLIPINVIVPALLAGNVVLLKHSERTPLTGQAFEQAFGQLEVENLVTHLILRHEQTADMLEDKRIDHVCFTGSARIGSLIYHQAARRFIDVGLELGGKDPAYVAMDADLDFAVENIVDGACYNAGQSCCAVERVYVHQSLYEPFLKKAAQLLEKYQLGDPFDEQTTMGPLARDEACEELKRHVDDAVQRGARLLVGGKAEPKLAGNFFEPTLLADVPNDALVMQEESFGPILPVQAVNDDREALERMNDTRFGLTASIWTNDLDLAKRMADEINAGTVFANRCDYLDPALAWTGVGDSGKGSSLSRYGYYHLTRPKSIYFRDRSR